MTKLLLWTEEGSECLQNFNTVMEIDRWVNKEQLNLRANAKKRVIVPRQLRYLGLLIDANGVHPDPDRVAALRSLRPSRNPGAKELPGVCRDEGSRLFYPR